MYECGIYFTSIYGCDTYFTSMYEYKLKLHATVASLWYLVKYTVVSRWYLVKY